MDHWHAPLRHIKGARLSGDTNQTTGMTRREAVSGKTVGSSKGPPAQLPAVRGRFAFYRWLIPAG